MIANSVVLQRMLWLADRRMIDVDTLPLDNIEAIYLFAAGRDVVLLHRGGTEAHQAETLAQVLAYQRWLFRHSVNGPAAFVIGKNICAEIGGNEAAIAAQRLGSRLMRFIGRTSLQAQCLSSAD